MFQEIYKIVSLFLRQPLTASFHKKQIMNLIPWRYG